MTSFGEPNSEYICGSGISGTLVWGWLGDIETDEHGYSVFLYVFWRRPMKSGAMWPDKIMFALLLCYDVGRIKPASLPSTHDMIGRLIQPKHSKCMQFHGSFSFLYFIIISFCLPCILANKHYY